MTRPCCCTCMFALAEPGERRCADCAVAYRASRGTNRKRRHADPPPLTADAILAGLVFGQNSPPDELNSNKEGNPL